MVVTTELLTEDAFRPFGEVLTFPAEPGRLYFEDALGSSRPGTRPSFSTVCRTPVSGSPIQVTLMERHEFSSQTFVPVEVGRWLVVVCPHAPGGGPDMSGARAFIAGPHQGVTYRMGTWHHGLMVLDRPASMAVFMWRDGTAADEEFVSVAPVTIVAC